MSRDRALCALNGQRSDRIAQWEFLSHPGLIQRATGLDPYERTREAWLAFVEKYDIDAINWPVIENAPRRRAGVTGASGGAVIDQWGLREMAWVVEPPLKTPEQILAFDPRPKKTAEIRQKVDLSWANYELHQKAYGERLLYVPGNYMQVLHYMTNFADWEVFLVTMLERPEECRALFDRCAENSRRVLEELAQTDAPLIICHEDLCNTQGLIFSPDFLRREIFPRYKWIFEPVKRAGKRLVFLSDGKVEDIVADILAAGADGVMVEAENDLEKIVNLVGPNGIVVGGCDTRLLTTGTPEEVREHTREKVEIAKRIPGFFFCLVGEAPQNVPTENLEAYFDAFGEFGRRRPDL
jgi:hypothetical protein